MQKIKFLFPFIFLLALLLTVSVNAQTLDLATLKDWKIVVTDDVIPAEKFAAQEFQSLFEKATGIKLGITKVPAAKTKNIFIGYSDFMRGSDCSFITSDLGKEGLRIKIQPDNIAIAGGWPRGTLYGVYEFAEKYLGIRFLAYDYTYIPDKKASMPVACEEYSYTPCFVYRSVYYKENIDHPEFSVKLRNNAFEKEDKYGGTCDMQFIVHSFMRQCPVEKFGKEHPEYFAEVGGKRLLEGWGGGPQIDVSNPDVIKEMSAAVCKEVGDHPELKNVSVVQNDNQNYCTCKNCEAINKREGSAMGAHLEMVNAIADEVKKKYPDVMVGTLAYQYTRKPPLTVIPRDNVMVQLCSIECDLTHAYTDPDNDMNKPFADDLAAWGKICNDLWIWDYMVDFGIYGLPIPNLHSIGKNLKYYKDHHVKGVFMEANYNCEAGEMSDLKNYITSRCLWNPELDSWELTKEFCNLYYKSASKPILEYLTKIHDRMDSKHLKARFNAKPSDVGLNADFDSWMLTKFAEAMKLADDDAVRDRVERASLCAYVAMIEGGRGEAKYLNGKVNYQSKDKYIEALKIFPALARKHHMDYYAEDDNQKIDSVEKNFNKELTIYTVGGRPAAQMENKDWRFTVLPEESGKVVEVRNKHSKVNLLTQDKTDLSQGSFTESLVKGIAGEEPVVFKSAMDKNTMKLACSFKDGTIYNRQITLAEDGSGKILCQSTVTNKTLLEKTYQLKVDFNTTTGMRERNISVLNASVKVNGKLAQFNRALIGTHGHDEHLLADGKDGGEIVLFNTKRKSGVVTTYHPQDTETIDASWNDLGAYFNFGFTTKEIKLKPGESFTFSYDFKYLDKLPEN